MPDRGQWTVIGSLGAYNLIQNRLLPARAYVPVNLLVGLGLVALARRHGCSWDDLGLDRSRVRAGLRLGGIAAAAASLGAIVASNHPRAGEYFLDQRAAEQPTGRVLYQSLVRFPLGTALFEEVAFRGVVEAIWRRSGTSPRGASAVAAAAFGIWHFIPGTQALTGNPLGPRFSSRPSRLGVVAAGALITSLSSFGFTWLRERSGSLVAPWLAHSAINSANYLAGVAAWRRAGEPKSRAPISQSPNPVDGALPKDEH